jgi:hypothetical protein
MYSSHPLEPNPMQCLDIHLLLALQFDKPHRRARCRFGNALGISVIILLRPLWGTYSGDISRTWRGRDFLVPVVGPLGDGSYGAYPSFQETSVVITQPR